MHFTVFTSKKDNDIASESQRLHDIQIFLIIGPSKADACHRYNLHLNKKKCFGIDLIFLQTSHQTITQHSSQRVHGFMLSRHHYASWMHIIIFANLQLLSILKCRQFGVDSALTRIISMATHCCMGSARKVHPVIRTFLNSCTNSHQYHSCCIRQKHISISDLPPEINLAKLTMREPA